MAVTQTVPQTQIVVSLEIENSYELYPNVQTTATDIEMPAPPADVDSPEYQEWSEDFIYAETGVGDTHTKGDAFYDVVVTASSHPDLLPVGTTFEFGY